MKGDMRGVSQGVTWTSVTSHLHSSIHWDDHITGMITSLGANPWRTPSFETAPWRDTPKSGRMIGAEWPELGRLSLLGSILVLLIVLLHLLGPLRCHHAL